MVLSKGLIVRYAFLDMVDTLARAIGGGQVCVTCSANLRIQCAKGIAGIKRVGYSQWILRLQLLCIHYKRYFSTVRGGKTKFSHLRIARSRTVGTIAIGFKARFIQ